MYRATVNLAGRVAGQAAGGQTLVTRAVADVARKIGYPVTCIGAMALRNVSEHQEWFEVGIGPRSRVGSVDPVCRMWVAPRPRRGTCATRKTNTGSARLIAPDASRPTQRSIRDPVLSTGPSTV